MNDYTFKAKGEQDRQVCADCIANAIKVIERNAPDFPWTECCKGKAVLWRRKVA